MSAGKVLVAGATGRLGKEVMAVLGARGVAAARRVDGAETVLLGPAGLADQAKLAGMSAIINCAGAVRGKPVVLDAANVAFATGLAAQARSAGVPVFVQVSSFSVYGQIERIFPDSPVDPGNAYGRSKADAEAEICAMTTPAFRPVAVRLPFMFSATDPGLIGTMIKALERLRVIPVRLRGQTQRSMLTYRGAAETLVDIANQNRATPSILAAADPRPFDMLRFARKLEATGARKLIEIPIPGCLEHAGYAVMPGLVSRILRSSVLEPEANFLRAEQPGWVEDELNKLLAGAGPTASR